MKFEKTPRLQKYLQRILDPVLLYGNRPSGTIDSYLEFALTDNGKQIIDIRGELKAPIEDLPYKTIALYTDNEKLAGVNIPAMIKKLPNLHVIIVQNITAFEVCKPIAKKQGVHLIGFNRHYAPMYVWLDLHMNPFFGKLPKQTDTLYWQDWIHHS